MENFSPPSQPVWWTTLAESAFAKSTPSRATLKAHCYKVQTWVSARAKLGGDPVMLSDVAGKRLPRCLKKLEKSS